MLFLPAFKRGGLIHTKVVKSNGKWKVFTGKKEKKNVETNSGSFLFVRENSCKFAETISNTFRIMDITGKIIAVLEPRSGVAKASGNPWKIQEYVLETIGEQYPKKMMFSIFGEDKIQQAAINIGDEVVVSFDINAREFNGRWYNDIRAWRVSHDVNGAAPAAQPYVQAAPAAAAPDPFAPSNEKDDLPF